MAGNKNLNDSARNKQDEFYTQLSLIENELRHYKAHFTGKVVLCNCDDPYESNFFKYFAINFNFLGIKKLIATCYMGSPIASTQLTLFDDEPIDDKTTKTPHKIVISEVDDYNLDGRVDLLDVEYLLRNEKNTLTRLQGDGDFRSKECIELLKQADIVVTNPPFSLFRDYMAQLTEYNKNFLIIGNLNAVKYKEILPLFMTDKVWLGNNSGHYWFKVPDTYEEKSTDFKIDETGQKWRRMGNICWFTNLDFEKRHEDMTLFRTYSPEIYPKYDDYEAIEVSKTADIPCDYDGVIGVPITFMTRHNPEQFSLIGVLNSGSGNEYDYAKAAVNGKQLYARILIRRKQGEDEN
ncbi:MAG: adenine-specific methyltransferase EcoRI family protein [Defluviitaleaceae bacterium]|nr:adenine-specific methyltransferase EcoRI family protein [Defluviitaleaceae bacterium]